MTHSVKKGLWTYLDCVAPDQTAQTASRSTLTADNSVTPYFTKKGWCSSKTDLKLDGPRMLKGSFFCHKYWSLTWKELRRPDGFFFTLFFFTSFDWLVWLWRGGGDLGTEKKKNIYCITTILPFASLVLCHMPTVSIKISQRIHTVCSDSYIVC